MKTLEPVATVTEIARAKPTLVIFDDDPVMLKQFAMQYDKDFTVIRVLVSNRDHEDLFVGDGTIRQQPDPRQAIAADDWEAQDAHREAPRDVRTILAGFRKHADDRTSTHSRYDADVEFYEAIAECDYGVSSKQEVADLLRSIKPNAVLSDMEMRKPTDYDATPEQQAADPEVVMGDHVMAMVKAFNPATPRAVHTTKYDVQESWPENRKAAQKTTRCVAETQAEKDGYLLRSKDPHGTKGLADELAGYFLGAPSAKRVV